MVMEFKRPYNEGYEDGHKVGIIEMKECLILKIENKVLLDWKGQNEFVS
jgi:hypothetical protein